MKPGANLGVDKTWGTTVMKNSGYGANLGEDQIHSDNPSSDYDEMAEQGRGTDSEMAHVTPGEIMIPPQVWEQNPQLQEAIRRAFYAEGRDPEEFMAGHPLQKINPITGQPEFGFFSKIFKSIKKIFKNPIVKAILPVALGFIPGVGPLASAAIGAGAGAIGGGGIKGAIMGGIGGYGGSVLASGLRAAGAIPVGAAYGPNIGTVGGGISNLLSRAPGAAGAFSGAVEAASLGGFAGAALKAAPLISSMMPSGAAPAAQKSSSVPAQGISQTPTAVPTNVPQAAATVPKGAGAPPSGVGLASAAPSGVSFLQPITNRNTGQTNYEEAPFSSALSNTRRGSFGASIFA